MMLINIICLLNLTVLHQIQFDYVVDKCYSVRSSHH